MQMPCMRLLLIIAALAAAPAAATEVVRLSAAERDAVLNAAAGGPERTAVLTPELALRRSVLDRPLYPEFDGSGPAVSDRRVHGEISVFAGSGGTFGVAGSALIPLGDSGSAAISVMQGTSRFGGLQGFGVGFASGSGARSGQFGQFGQFGIGGAFGGSYLGRGMWALQDSAAQIPFGLHRRR